MTKKLVLKLFIFLLLCNLSIHDALALTATEQFIQDLLSTKPKYPTSTVRCNARGSIQKIITDPVEFSSDGSAFFYDKDATKKRMAILQSGAGLSADGKKKYQASIFIRADGVTETNIRDLIIKRKIVATNNAKVVFVVYVTEGTKTKTYLYESNGKIDDPGDTTLYTNFTHVGNISSGGTKYIVASGSIRINFPKPPDLLANIDPLEVPIGPGVLVCTYHKLPLDDNYLPGIDKAFAPDEDGNKLSDAIKTEAGL